MDKKTELIVQCVKEFCRNCPQREGDICKGYDQRHKVPCELLPIFNHYSFMFGTDFMGAPSYFWKKVRKVLKKR